MRIYKQSHSAYVNVSITSIHPTIKLLAATFAHYKGCLATFALYLKAFSCGLFLKGFSRPSDGSTSTKYGIVSVNNSPHFNPLWNLGFWHLGKHNIQSCDIYCNSYLFSQNTNQSQHIIPKILRADTDFYVSVTSKAILAHTSLSTLRKGMSGSCKYVVTWRKTYKKNWKLAIGNSIEFSLKIIRLNRRAFERVRNCSSAI